MLPLKNILQQKFLIPTISYLSITLIGVAVLFSCKTPPPTSTPVKKSQHTGCVVSGQAAVLRFPNTSNTDKWYLDDINPITTAIVTNIGPGPALIGTNTNLFPADVASLDSGNGCYAGLCLASGDTCNLVIDSTPKCNSRTGGDPSECGAGFGLGGAIGSTGIFSFSYTDGTGTKTAVNADDSSPVSYACNCDD